MKGKNIFLVALAVVIMSSLGEVALSESNADAWSNYVQSWETKWTTPVKQRSQNVQPFDEEKTSVNKKNHGKNS